MVKKSSLIPGILLVLAGILLMLRQLDVIFIQWEFIYPLVFLLVGGLFFIFVFVRNDKSAAFWGTLFFLLGILFYLYNFGVGPFYYWGWGVLWPFFLIIPGLAFIILFLVDKKDWGVLIPGFILVLIGASFMLNKFDFYWNPWDYLGRYWPVMLIIIGVIIVITRLSQKPGTSEKE